VHRVGLGDDRVGEVVGDAVLVDRDERYGARPRRIAEPRDHAGARQSEARLRSGKFGLHQFAVAGRQGGAGGDGPFPLGPLVDRHDAPALGRLAEDAEDAVRRLADAADQARLVVVPLGLDLRQTAEDAVAPAKRRVALARDDQHARLRALTGPFERLGEKVALPVRAEHFEHRDRRQPVRVAVGAAALLEVAVRLQFLQDTLEVHARGALDAEGLGDVALGALGRMVGDPGEDFVLGGNAGHDRCEVARPGGGVIREGGSSRAGCGCRPVLSRRMSSTGTRSST
jgi:hypothetical protein